LTPAGPSWESLQYSPGPYSWIRGGERGGKLGKEGREREGKEEGGEREGREAKEGL